jgi:arsenate reductase
LPCSVLRHANSSDLDDAKLLQAMRDYPALIQRPIVVAGDAARIGRPPEAVLEIIPT